MVASAFSINGEIAPQFNFSPILCFRCKIEYHRCCRPDEKNWCANQTNDMFYPFCIIRSRKPCKTQRTGFQPFLPFLKSPETPAQSYLRRNRELVHKMISTQNEFLWFVPFLPFSKLSEKPVQSYLLTILGITTRNEFLRFVPFLPFSKSSEMPVQPYLCTL